MQWRDKTLTLDYPSTVVGLALKASWRQHPHLSTGNLTSFGRVLRSHKTNRLTDAREQYLGAPQCKDAVALDTIQNVVLLLGSAVPLPISIFVIPVCIPSAISILIPGKHNHKSIGGGPEVTVD